MQTHNLHDYTICLTKNMNSELLRVKPNKVVLTLKISMELKK